MHHMPESFDLPEDPDAALDRLRSASTEGPVVVFKRSPTCPISHKAEWELKSFLQGLDPDDDLIAVTVDVLAQRSLARGLSRALGINHESPQTLWFEGGELIWHGSHGALTQTQFRSLKK